MSNFNTTLYQKNYRYFSNLKILISASHKRTQSGEVNCRAGKDSFVKRLASLYLFPAFFVASSSSALAGVVVDITFNDPTDSTITLALSGSQEVTSDMENDGWDISAYDLDLWRDVNNLNSSGPEPYTESINTIASTDAISILGGDASASVSGGDSIALSDVWLYGSGTRSDLSIGFAADPNPVFSIGDIVTFSGTVTIDLGSNTAAIFNTGTWTDSVTDLTSASRPTSPGDGFSNQFDSLDLTYNITQVPEPSFYAGVFGLLTLAVIAIRRRRM